MSTSVVELHVISDSTGETAVRLVLALEAQFPDTEFEVVRHPRVETVDDVQLAVSRTKDRPAVIVYTLVDTQLRDTMGELCRRDSLHCCDLLGQPIEEVAAVSGKAAKMESGRRPPLDSHYFKRMEAIEFAVKFDDGLGAGPMTRTSCSSGYRARRRRRSRCTWATSATRSRTCRSCGASTRRRSFWRSTGRRSSASRSTPSASRKSARCAPGSCASRRAAYSELVEIYEELEQAAAVHRQLGCPVVDVSELSIEETAQRVLRIVERRRSATASA